LQAQAQSLPHKSRQSTLRRDSANCKMFADSNTPGLPYPIASWPDHCQQEYEQEQWKRAHSAKLDTVVSGGIVYPPIRC